MKSKLSRHLGMTFKNRVPRKPWMSNAPAATAASAAYVHKTTYKHPTDVRFQAAGTAGDAGH